MEDTGGKKPFNDKLSIPELEEEVMRWWEADKTFAKSLAKTRRGQPYTFYDGPPFATGLPHYGHILASTIKDLIPRYQTMRGRFVRRRWGWDCHGLPIEEIVERELGISGKKQIEAVGIRKFNETCRATVLKFADEWRKMVRRMGRWVDFDNSYKTMDRTYMESVWWAFKQIYDKGLVYEGRKVLLYCPRCETPISNFEVAMDQSYKDITEESVIVKFPISNFQFPKSPSGHSERSEESSVSTGEDPSALPQDDRIYFLAWTTTPWTLPGNVALAVGADINYAALRVVGQEGMYVVARDLIKKVFGDTQLEIVHDDIKGSDLAGLEYEPLFNIPAVRSDKSFKVYPADFVTTEEGTGIVHTAVVYGEDDYKLGLEVGLPVVPLLDEKGRFNDKAPEFLRGQYFKDAEPLIKKDLESRGLIFKKENTIHSYPHCWRCGTILFYNAIPAWFINIQKIKPELLRTNEAINWYPEHLKHGRYAKSVEAAPDWNVSRNRYWGNPIPVWKCAQCSEIRVAGSIADLGLQPTTFYFLRHGEGEQNAEGIASCYPEVKPYPLTEKGRKQAEAAAAHLQKEGVELIFSSDLARAAQTAEIIAKAVGGKVVTDERLREVNIGVWNGKPVADYETAHPTGWDKSAEGGETWTELQMRMLSFVHEMSARYPGKKIVVVSHGDPIWIGLLALGMDIPGKGDPEFGRPFKITTGLTDLHRPYIDAVVLKCAKCGGEARRVTEIFDSWVEAGSMPFAEYHYPFENQDFKEKHYPADFVAEYIAQTRAWFYVMHVIGNTLFGGVPFKNVVTTGNILAEDGSKMSKSKNNYPDPWLTIGKYGVDTLRFYLMNSVVMQSDDINFSEKDLGNVYRQTTLILWNVYKYFVTYAPSVIPAKAGIQKLLAWIPGQARDDKQHVLDRWIKARLKELVNETTDCLDRYDTVQATRAMAKFVDDLSTWYLRRSRGREDAGFYPVFAEVLATAARVIAPVMPHLAEVIYRNVKAASGERGAESVHLAEWPAKEVLTGEEQEVLKQMNIIREDASAGLAISKEKNRPIRQPLEAEIRFKEVIDPEIALILMDELNVKEGITIQVVPEDIKTVKNITGTAMTFSFKPTPELKLEGLTRQLERFVQELRKKQGFKVGERAVLRYETTDAETGKALQAVDRKKTYLFRIEKGGAEGGEDFEGKAKIKIERS